MIRKLLEVFGNLPPPYDQLSVLTSVLNKSVSTLKDTRHRMSSWTDQAIKASQEVYHHMDHVNEAVRV
ncbi:hypothetical protein HaLaN_28072, partial [Haematococcus lacustris]